MKRVSAERGMNAQFVRITWDEALSTIATQLETCKASYGQYSVYNSPVALYHNCGVTGWGCISNEGSFQAGRWMLGSGWGIGCGGFFPGADDITNVFYSKLIVMWACNPVSTSASGMAGGGTGWILRLAHEKGIPIIILDPRYTDSSQMLADQSIPIRPGTDLAMMLAVANVLFTNNLYDADYVSKNVEQLDYRIGRIMCSAILQDQMDSKQGPLNGRLICGVPADTITAFAHCTQKQTYILGL